MMNHRYLGFLFLILPLLVGLACGISPRNPIAGSEPPATPVPPTLEVQAQETGEDLSEDDRIATRVAEDLAVAATLTAVAGAAEAPADTPVVVPEETTEPTQPPTDTPTPRPGCTVVSNGLNLRTGPDTSYQPPITQLPNGTALTPQGRNAEGTWIVVQVVDTGQVGWVSSAAQFVSCSVDVPGLPVAQIPPTPTVAATPTPPPPAAPPTPTPPRLVVDPIEGDGNWLAEILHPGYFPAATSELFFQVRAYDGDYGTHDGDGIDYVDFYFYDANDDLVYDHREENASFCAFGGSHPCPALVFAQNDYRWPNGNPIQNGPHTLEVEVQGENRDVDAREGVLRFNIQSPHQAPAQQGNLVVRIVQTGPGTTSSTVRDSLVFQAEAHDSSAGTHDGAGIANVDMRIIDSSGREVYHRRENNAAYCAFSGGEPDCTVWVFDHNNYQWRDTNVPIRSGTYTLRATANTPDGRHQTAEATIQIQLE
jgi:hypothetical protein